MQSWYTRCHTLTLTGRVSLTAARGLPTARCRLLRFTIMSRRNESEEQRAARKAATKAGKAEKRAERQGQGDPAKGRKPCTLCTRPRDLLVRCQVDPTSTWHMVCGKCWLKASGGAVDGCPAVPYYRYGGLWKNHHKGVSGRGKVPAGGTSIHGSGGDSGGAGAGGSSGRVVAGDGGSRVVGIGKREDSGAGEISNLHGGSGAAEEVGDMRPGREGGAGASGGGDGVVDGSTRALLLREAALCEAADS